MGQGLSRGMTPRLPEGVELSRDGKTLKIDIPGTGYQIQDGKRIDSQANPQEITADGSSPLKVKVGKDGHITVTSKTDDGKTNTYEFVPEKRPGADRPSGSHVGEQDFKVELPRLRDKQRTPGT